MCGAVCGALGKQLWYFMKITRHLEKTCKLNTWATYACVFGRVLEKFETSRGGAQGQRKFKSLLQLSQDSQLTQAPFNV